MFIIGITGGIGSGKSTVAAILRTAGIDIVDADQISHTVTAPGGSAVADIIDIFGTDILDENGAIDRKKLANIVFSDRKKLDQLSLIIHSEVISEIGKRIKQLTAAGKKVVALDVPIPVEHGFIDRCDTIWSVYTPEPIRIKRLLERGLSEDEAQRRISMQLTREEFQKLSDKEIINDDNFDTLHLRVKQLLEQELGARGIPYLSI